jgi:D-lyxose ketol-isomerase
VLAYFEYYRDLKATRYSLNSRNRSEKKMIEFEKLYSPMHHYWNELAEWQQHKKGMRQFFDSL